jgi:hypothetical protein
MRAVRRTLGPVRRSAGRTPNGAPHRPCSDLSPGAARGWAHPNAELLEEPEARLIINVGRTLLNYLDAKRAFAQEGEFASAIELPANAATATTMTPCGLRMAASWMYRPPAPVRYPHNDSNRGTGATRVRL